MDKSKTPKFYKAPNGIITELEIDSVKSWARGALAIIKEHFGESDDERVNDCNKNIVGYLTGLATDKDNDAFLAFAIDKGRGDRLDDGDRPIVADIMQEH